MARSIPEGWHSVTSRLVVHHPATLAVRHTVWRSACNGKRPVRQRLADRYSHRSGATVKRGSMPGLYGRNHFAGPRKLDVYYCPASAYLSVPGVGHVSEKVIFFELTVCG